MSDRQINNDNTHIKGTMIKDKGLTWNIRSIKETVWELVTRAIR